MNFTPEQQSAIDAKNRELLVSAAAGSGKTAVLVRRILHLIRDADYSIDRMLVVTYTRAAAAELRDRLETAALVDEPNAPSAISWRKRRSISRFCSARTRSPRLPVHRVESSASLFSSNKSSIVF